MCQINLSSDALEWAENRKILVKSNIFQNRQANFLPGLVELTSQPIRVLVLGRKLLKSVGFCWF